MAAQLTECVSILFFHAAKNQEMEALFAEIAATRQPDVATKALGETIQVFNETAPGSIAAIIEGIVAYFALNETFGPASAFSPEVDVATRESAEAV